MYLSACRNRIAAVAAAAAETMLAGFECAQQLTGLTSSMYKPFQGGPAGAAHHSSVSHHEPAV